MPVEAGPLVGPILGTLTLSSSADTADVGQSVRLTVTLAEDPATIVLTLTLPDATAQIIAIGGLTRLSLGVYVYDYVTTLPGQYTATAVSTVPNAADDTVFIVTGSPSPVSLSFVKAHLNISLADQTNDAELKAVIDAAVALAENICGPITPRTVTEVHDECSSIVLRCFPVISVQTVTPSAGTIGSYVLTQGGVLNLYQAYSFQPYGLAPTTITVTYTAGRSTIPANITLGLAELVRHLWQPQGGSRVNVGQEDWDPREAYAVPKRVIELFGREALGPGIG